MQAYDGGRKRRTPNIKSKKKKKKSERHKKFLLIQRIFNKSKAYHVENITASCLSSYFNRSIALAERHIQEQEKQAPLLNNVFAERTHPDKQTKCQQVLKHQEMLVAQNH